MQRDSSKQTPRDKLLLLRSGDAKRRIGCAALRVRRTQASEPTLTAFGLAAKRRADCARANLSWYFVPVFHNVIDCCCCVPTSTYPRRGARRVRFPWSIGPSPRQPPVVWPRRDAPPADRASCARQRGCAAVWPSISSIVLRLLAVVDNMFHGKI